MPKQKQSATLTGGAKNLLRDRGQPATLCRRVRAALGESQPEFAERLGVHWKTVSAYESGREPLGLVRRELEKLARRHGVTP